MDLIKLREQLVEHEGLRLHPYKCTAGKTTIGVGRNLDDRGITRAEAMDMLQHDIDECASDCVLIVGQSVWDKLSDARQRVLVDMRFNLGPRGLRSFARTLAAISQGRYAEASEYMLESKWATQVKGRALRLAKMMRDG
jgi:lysozyme